MIQKQSLLIFIVGILSLFPAAIPGLAADSPPPAKNAPPAIALSEDMGDAMVREASRVKETLGKQALSLFERNPMGWGWHTIDYLYKWLLSLPLKLPALMADVLEQGRVLGVVGSLLMLLFIGAVLYSLLGQKHLLARIDATVSPHKDRLPEGIYPFLFSGIRIVIAALLPLLLTGVFALINAMIVYSASWFRLTGRLLVLWAVGALVIGLLRESLTRGLFKSTVRHGRSIFRLARLALVYVLAGVAVIWAAEIFVIRPDVLALFKFVISISIVLVLFLLHLKKRAVLSLLPDLPYGGYNSFLRFLERYYFPFIFLSLVLALLWCVGYRQMGRTVLVKIWLTGGAYLLIMVLHHMLGGLLQRWKAKTDPANEAARLLFRSVKSMLVYATVLATILIVLNLLGLLRPLQQVMSFPVFQLGQTRVTCWIIIKAALILAAFLFASGLLQSYLDYKIYPKVGIEPGLGYALNTFLKYFLFAVGFLISLKVVGLDLRFLLVFAGAIGVGVGLGLQNMAANIISGFSLIFGGKIRKGDWIEVGGTLGMVTDIYLHATKVRTRNNVEYLIPNAGFISGTIVNYSLSSPLIRIDLAVGVSYDADPNRVRDILIDVAKAEPLVEKYKAPEVRFVEYGDNAINFQLLFWIDVAKTARRKVRSELYFGIFEALKAAGIEIPYPQRVVHFPEATAGLTMEKKA